MAITLSPKEKLNPSAELHIALEHEHGDGDSTTTTKFTVKLPNDKIYLIEDLLTGVKAGIEVVTYGESDVVTTAEIHKDAYQITFTIDEVRVSFESQEDMTSNGCEMAWTKIKSVTYFDDNSNEFIVSGY